MISSCSFMPFSTCLDFPRNKWKLEFRYYVFKQLDFIFNDVAFTEIFKRIFPVNSKAIGY